MVRRDEVGTENYDVENLEEMVSIQEDEVGYRFRRNY